MPIKKKDGNVYVLEGPNPIVSGQVSWNPNDLVFHNFSWDEITYSQGVKRPAAKTAPVPEKTPSPPQPAPIPEPVIPELENAHTSPEPETQPKEFDLPYIKYKVLCYCLPATVKTHEDKLYGESWQKVLYGHKFIFPCIMIDSSDMMIQFWTSDPKSQIGEKSIIYPFSYEVHNIATDSYDRVPFDEYRWWKVSEKEAKEGGWLFRCVPSENQPDFSG